MSRFWNTQHKTCRESTCLCIKILLATNLNWLSNFTWNRLFPAVIINIVREINAALNDLNQKQILHVHIRMFCIYPNNLSSLQSFLQVGKVKLVMTIIHMSKFLSNNGSFVIACVLKQFLNVVVDFFTNVSKCIEFWSGPITIKNLHHVIKLMVFGINLSATQTSKDQHKTGLPIKC